MWQNVWAGNSPKIKFPETEYYFVSKNVTKLVAGGLWWDSKKWGWGGMRELQVKELEELGVGRPSTYAPIIKTLEVIGTCVGHFFF